MAASSSEFHRISGEYDKGRISEDIAFWAQEARKIGGLTESSLVVDMGCGTGNYGMGIRGIVGCTVVGFDPVPGMLRQAIEKDLGFPIVRAVSEKMPFRSNTFDMIYAAQMWHHVQGRQESANECYRVTRRGGVKIVHTISHSQLHEKVVFKFFPEIMENQLRVYPSDDEFNDIFRKAGFTKVEIHPYKIERYQSASELIEVAEKKLWSMFRPISDEGLKKGVDYLREYEKDHNGEPVRNDELITLFVASK